MEVRIRTQSEEEVARTVTVIEPGGGWASIKPSALRDLWDYRELAFFLVWKDIKVRYKQTVLGASWAVLQPLMTMVIFSVIFGRLAQLSSEGLPYPIFAYTALLPWIFFAQALSRSGTSIVTNSGLISKVYFPRLIVPFSSAISGLVDFGIAFVILLGLMAYYGIAPTLAVLALPLFLLLALFTALGVALWLSAINVRYRDVAFAIPFLIQMWMYASPVAYSSTLVPEKWRDIYLLNPMAAVVEGFRWGLLGTEWHLGTFILAPVGAVALVFVSGMIFFQRMQRRFVDVI